MLKYRHYVGLDAHKANSFFVVLDGEGNVLERVKVVTSETALVAFVAGVPGPKALALEESHLSQWLYLTLAPEVDQLVVCNPAQRPSPQGPKTDYLDALELANLLRLNALRGVYHGAKRWMDLRTLLSGYGDVTQELVRAKNRYRALFARSAQGVGGDAFYRDARWMERLEGETERYVAQPLWEQIQLLQRQHDEYQKRLAKNVKACKAMRLLSSIPGLGAVRVNQLVGVVIEPQRFADKYHFYSYAGLVKHPKISDGVSYGKRRARGNRRLKEVFKSAALDALRGENALRLKYELMRANGSTAAAARNAVARTLAAVSLAVWKTGKKFNNHQLEGQVRQHYPA